MFEFYYIGWKWCRKKKKSRKETEVTAGIQRHLYQKDTDTETSTQWVSEEAVFRTCLDIFRNDHLCDQEGKNLQYWEMYCSQW